MLPHLVTPGLAAALSVAATPLFAALARRRGLGLALAALSAVGRVLFLFLHDVDVYGRPAPRLAGADFGAPALRAIWGRVRFGADPTDVDHLRAQCEGLGVEHRELLSLL